VPATPPPLPDRLADLPLADLSPGTRRTLARALSALLSLGAAAPVDARARRRAARREEALLLGRWESAVRLPLAVVARAGAEGSDAAAESAARAALCIAEWALARGDRETARAFVDGAAAARPGDVRYACLSARMLPGGAGAAGRPREGAERVTGPAGAAPARRS
jgi:hypothetical protein